MLMMLTGACSSMGGLFEKQETADVSALMKVLNLHVTLALYQSVEV